MPNFGQFNINNKLVKQIKDKDKTGYVATVGFFSQPEKYLFVKTCHPDKTYTDFGQWRTHIKNELRFKREIEFTQPVYENMKEVA
jgi:hypothetical protein